MVLQKRLDYGFNGYQVPPTPRAARSARRRCLFRRKVDNDQQMCAFDLLATVAGKLLLEGESLPKTVKTVSDHEQTAVLESDFTKTEHDGDKASKEKLHDQDSSVRSFIVSELVTEAPMLKFCSNEVADVKYDSCSGPASAITSESSEKIGSAEMIVNGDSKVELGSFSPKALVKSSGSQISSYCRLEGENKKEIKSENPNNRNSPSNNRTEMFSLGCPQAWDRKPSALVSSINSVKFPFCRDHNPCGSFPVNREDVNLVNRDDDENSSGCTQPSTKNKAFRSLVRVGYPRVVEMLDSKHQKETPNMKDEERYKDYTERCNFQSRKNGYKRQRPQRDYPIKKRKLYESNSVSDSEEGVGGDAISSFPEHVPKEDALISSPSFPEVNVTPTSAASGHASFQARIPHVKLKIKSFRVPELFVEIPETATVGSLKRTVMEAVTAILGRGVRVGVLVQGKKIRDDNKTLLQTGISHDNKLDALGFTLEPNTTQAPLALFPEERTSLLPPDTAQPLARYPSTPTSVPNALQQGNRDALADPTGSNFNTFVESDHDSAPSPPDMSSEKTTESRALATVPPMKVEALAVVPMRKSKRSESAQRRIRRPFTVAEVEALVQAVEKLGTGRWRDVKLRAFDNAKHRTYVDLKDKWKTLVHTARISPQQRRGEPVPQELLDRVLTAHAYWSQQQAKQHLKSQPETCLVL